MSDTLKQYLEGARAWNDAVRTERDAIAALIVDSEKRAARPEENRDRLTAEEDAEFRRLSDELRANDERIAEIELDLAAEARSGRVSMALGETRVDVRSEPLTYQRQRSTYFSDLYKMTQGDVEAKSRLERHGKEMDVEMPRREAQRARNAEIEVRNSIGWDTPTPFEKRTNPNRTDGQGGYLVPPLWMMDELIPLLRAGRVVADQVRNMPLPDGTDSINLPKISGGSSTAIQTADGASVSSTDMTDTSVTAGVKTIAGQEDVSIQLVEQSPLSLDEIVFTDLVADYNKKLDLQVIAGSNSSGQMNGLYSSAGQSNWTGYSQVAYTDGSPTVPEFYPVFAQTASKISQARFDISSLKYFLHPRRWFWIVGAIDSSNRPLVLPRGMGAFNPVADLNLNAQGYVGDVATGAPAFIDANITTADTAGSGSSQDIMFALNTSDAYLFEGQLRQRTLPEVLSGTMQVRFQVYNYCAFLLRYGEALAIASGTGFAAPSGY